MVRIYTGFRQKSYDFSIRTTFFRTTFFFESHPWLSSKTKGNQLYFLKELHAQNYVHTSTLATSVMGSIIAEPRYLNVFFRRCAAASAKTSPRTPSAFGSYRSPFKFLSWDVVNHAAFPDSNSVRGIEVASQKLVDVHVLR